jgi:hypothetical protein
LQALKTSDFDQVLDACNEELDGGETSELSNGFENGEPSSGFVKNGMKLLRATFNILRKKQKEAMEDLNEIIDDENAPANIK